MGRDVVDEVVGLLDLVGLDAADEVRLGLLERLDELRERRAEVVDDADELGALEAARSLRAALQVFLGLLGEEVLDELVVRELHQDSQVLPAHI